ncbi:MAG TPA: hypothetical protein VMM77_01260 [Gemmatimonadaceae bacterium]|nr:hypothetical protein [Gemmatimonadaceae bacterium]
MLHQRDFILRLIEQAGTAAARLRAMLGLCSSADAEVVAREAEQAQAALLGSLWPAVRVLDPPSAAMLVGNERQLRAWVELLRVQAAARERNGAVEESRRLMTRAEALERHAPSAEA